MFHVVWDAITEAAPDKAFPLLNSYAGAVKSIVQGKKPDPWVPDKDYKGFYFIRKIEFIATCYIEISGYWIICWSIYKASIAQVCSPKAGIGKAAGQMHILVLLTWARFDKLFTIWLVWVLTLWDTFTFVFRGCPLNTTGTLSKGIREKWLWLYNTWALPEVPLLPPKFLWCMLGRESYKYPHPNEPPPRRRKNFG
eukprot:SAG31_NODE_9135_length_1328_cov_1.399512_2_plen_196_part_00